MSDFGVYDDEMLINRFSDQDVERLLSGEMPEDEDLARLAPILMALHGQPRAPMSHDRVIRLAAQAAEIAMSTRPEQSGTAAPERTPTPPRRFALALRRKLSTGLAALLLLAGATGVAAASNGAAPGDILYGLDRALEEVGIADGGASERIAEAQALFNAGQIADAVAHAAEAVEVTDIETSQTPIEIQQENGPESAFDALMDAADEVRSGGDTDDESEAVRGRVAEMLEEMAEMLAAGDFDDPSFGEAVANMARGIGGQEENPGVDIADDARDNRGTDTAGDATDNEGTDTAGEATDNEGTDTAGAATDNEGTDTADDATDNAGDSGEVDPPATP